MTRDNIEWLIFSGVFLVVIGAIVWYLIGWRNRLFRGAEPESQEEDVVSGRLLDRETLERIGGRIWGKAVRRRYIPDEFPGPIKCVIHKEMLLPGQYFWETPLLDRQTKVPTGDNFAICTACQPGDATAVNHA